MKCPRCSAINRETAKFCTKCGTALPPSENPSVDLGPYPSVYQEFHHLRVREPGEMALISPEADTPPYSSVSPPRVEPPEGRERSVAWSFILSLLTCGIYGFVWLYMIGKDLQKLTGRDEPHPGLDVFLTLLTCNIWAIYLAYKYPKLIDEAQAKRHLPESRLSLVCLFLAVFGIWQVYGLGLIGLALMQNEINNIWRKSKS